MNTYYLGEHSEKIRHADRNTPVALKNVVASGIKRNKTIRKKMQAD